MVLDLVKPDYMITRYETIHEVRFSSSPPFDVGLYFRSSQRLKRVLICFPLAGTSVTPNLR